MSDYSLDDFIISAMKARREMTVVIKKSGWEVGYCVLRECAHHDVWDIAQWYVGEVEDISSSHHLIKTEILKVL